MGGPVLTLLRGRIACREGELAGTPSGAPVRFLDCLPRQE
jgi:hypothetical protein